MKVIVDSARITEVEAAQDSEQSEVEEAEESAE